MLVAASAVHAATAKAVANFALPAAEAALPPAAAAGGEEDQPEGDQPEEAEAEMEIDEDDDGIPEWQGWKIAMLVFFLDNY